MNKKETAEMESLRNQLRLAKAMRFTEEVKPDVAPPDSGDGLTTGFYFNSYDRGHVDVGCSSSAFHGKGRVDKTSSQRPMWLYSTRLLALRAMRHEMEKDVAARLARVDEQIEKELEAEAYQPINL